MTPHRFSLATGMIYDGKDAVARWNGARLTMLPGFPAGLRLEILKWLALPASDPPPASQPPATPEDDDDIRKVDCRPSPLSTSVIAETTPVIAGTGRKLQRTPAASSIPPCPPEDPQAGDKTPAVVAWWFHHHPEQAEQKYRNRRFQKP